MQLANQWYDETSTVADEVATSTPSVQIFYAIAMLLLTIAGACSFVLCVPCMQRCRQMIGKSRTTLIDEVYVSSVNNEQSRAVDVPPQYDQVCNVDSGSGADPTLPSYTDYIRSLHVVVVVDLSADRRLNSSSDSPPSSSSALPSSLFQQHDVISVQESRQTE